METANPIQAAIAAKKLTQAQVAEALGVTRQAVQKWISGTPPTLTNLKKLSAYLGLSVAVLSGESEAPDGGGNDREYSLIDRSSQLHGEGWTIVNVIDAYGGCSLIGACEQSGEVIGAVEFADGFLLSSHGVVGRITPERFKLIKPSGDSMEPTIQKMDHCLVDTFQNEIRGDGIYWIQIEGTYFLKRIARNFDRSITLISDNSRYPAQVVPREVMDTATVIGRVVRVIGFHDA